jgi:hypothetical protein
MAEWSNPVPPIPLLRSRYPELDSDAEPISSLAIFAFCAAAATLWVAIMIPQMDRLVLKVIRIFKPSFPPYEAIFGIHTTTNRAPSSGENGISNIALNLTFIPALASTHYVASIGNGRDLVADGHKCPTICIRLFGCFPSPSWP